MNYQTSKNPCVMKWRPHLSPLLFLLSALSGCGASTPGQLPVFPVRGQVVFNGQPVPGATITFYKEGAAVPASGMTDAKGEYHISTYAENDGAVVGKHRVTVSLPLVAPTDAESPDPEPPKAIADLESPEYRAGMQKVLDSNLAKASATKSMRIPAKYASVQSTSLEVEVRNVPENTIELLLRD